MRLFARFRTLLYLAAATFMLAGIGLRSSGPVQAQGGPGQFNLPKVFVSEEEEMRGYGFEGDLIDTEIFDLDSSDNVNPHDAVLPGYIGRNGFNNPSFGHLIADVETGFAAFTIAALNGAITATFFDAGFGAGDALAVGNTSEANDLAGGSFEEMLFAHTDTGEVDVYASNLSLDVNFIGSLDLDFEAGDGFATGDLAALGEDGAFRAGPDGVDEILIAEPEPDNPTDIEAVAVYLGSGEIFAFVTAVDYETGDGFAVGDVNGFGEGLGTDDIVVADADTGEITVVQKLEGSAEEIVGTVSTPFDAGDGLALGDVDGNLTEEILVADAATGQVTVYRYNFDEDEAVEGDEFIIRNTFDVGFESGNLFSAISLRLPDSDGDGLLDHWEEFGLDADGDDVIDVDLPAFGAEVLHKDIFVEYDYLPDREPDAQAIQLVQDAFAAAPVDAGGLPNPDGEPGINLWVDTGGLLDDGVVVGDDLGNAEAELPDDPEFCSVDNDFYAAKRQHFDPNRSRVFRYAVSGSRGGQVCDSGGNGEIGGNDFIVNTLAGDVITGLFPSQEEIERGLATEAGTFMHELGHNLNLQHGGPPVTGGDNCKPNYVSIMNYDHRFIERTDGSLIVDYSPPRFPGGRGAAPLPELREDDLSELTILDPADPVNQFIFTAPDSPADPDDDLEKILHPLNATVDWNQNGREDANLPPLNINTAGRNADGVLVSERCENSSTDERLVGHHDWNAIVIPFRRSGENADGPINPTTVPEPTAADIIALQQSLHEADLTIEMAISADPVAAGAEFDYTLTVANDGPNPAGAVQATATLPAGVSYVSDDAGCGVSGAVVTCDLGYVLSQTSQDIVITVQSEADLVFEAGGPLTLTAMAAVVDTQFEEDPDSGNNAASVDVEVVAEADLEFLSFAPVDAPLDILVGETAGLTLEQTVTNNGPSAPVDASVSVTEPPTSGGLSVEADPDNPSELLALGAGEIRELSARFTLLCLEPGTFALTFSTEATPVGATDPEPANNVAAVELTLNCVLPVALNIQPGSFPNVIDIDNLTGAAPLAVLSTAAGELDLPFAVDALQIDAGATLFGPREALFNVATPVGAPELNGQLDARDAFELDETTKDGDLDAALRFGMAGSGLEVTDTEACVRGVLNDATFGAVTFFGCDAVVPPPDVCVRAATGQPLLPRGPECGEREIKIVFELNGPHTLCFDRLSGTVTYSQTGVCPGGSVRVVLPDDGPLTVCASRVTTELRWTPSGQCLSNELPYVLE